MIITVLFYIFVAVTVIQLCYYISFIPFLLHKTTKKPLNECLPISVIVCAKNEVINLKKLVPLLLEQHYNHYELVLINDASNDETLRVMKKFKENDSRITVVNVQNNEAFWGNKKYALTLGIKAATHEQLLFTDADCIPASKNWIKEMSVLFSESKSIVIGYGAYQSKKHSFVNLLVRFETLLSAIQYFSYAKLKAPYMAVGRNLAYTKSEFFRVNGFINHMQIRSGDDDLFIRDAATSSNTTIALAPNSFTFSEAPTSLKKWFRQKRRHVTTASHYKYKHQFFLGLFYSSKLLFFLLAPFVLAYKLDIITGSLAVSYVVFTYLIVGFSAKKLKETSLLYFLPFLELFLVLFQFVIFITNSISKPTHWK
jgi:glycosyltransferase involved in cell wall biosynthesis